METVLSFPIGAGCFLIAPGDLRASRAVERRDAYIVSATEAVGQMEAARRCHAEFVLCAAEFGTQRLHRLEQ
jgi:hypothetical protein